MKRIAILTLSLALTIMALSLTTVRADTDSVRYSFIIGRNPFSLTTITARVEISPPPVVPPPPLATVELTGVISIPFPRALLEILPGPGKPLIKPILTEGQKVESIELVSIDIDRGQVTIKNSGVLTNILLKIAKASTPGMSSADTGSREDSRRLRRSLPSPQFLLG